MNTLLEAGQEIKLLREQAGWSQQKLVDEMLKHGTEFSRNYIAGVESGSVKPSAALLRACEIALNQPAGALSQFSALATAERWCKETHLSISDFLEYIKTAYKSPQSAPPSPGSPSPSGKPGSKNNVGITARRKVNNRSLIRHWMGLYWAWQPAMG